MTATESKQPDRAVPRDRFVGSTIAEKYKIVAPIARGGMGRVYRAVQVALEREVAIKLLDVGELMAGRSRKASGDAFRQRFLLEAASCAKLNHPNTVVIYDYGTVADDVYYIAMEHLSGKTLHELVDEAGTLDYRRIVHIALQICDSVGDAHMNGLVHRDLKPSNVMVLNRQGDPNYVKVLDFGLVKRAHEDDSDLTQSGAMVGTPRYMPPEQIERDEVTPASDVYSLGACLYHALAGRPPFEADSKFGLMMAHLEQEPPRFSDVSESVVPAEIEEVVRTCMRKDPRERFQTMGELSAALVAASTPYDPLARSVASWQPMATPSGRFRRPSALEAASGKNRNSGRSKRTSSKAPKLPTTRFWNGRSKLPMVVALVSTFAFVGSVSLAVAAGTEDGARVAGLPVDPFAAPNIGKADLTVAANDAVISVERAIEIAPSRPKLVVTPVAKPPAKRSVAVTTDPPGVSVMHQGMDLGDTPLSILVPEGETWSLELSAAGYHSRTIRIDAEQGELWVKLRKPAVKVDDARPAGRASSAKPKPTAAKKKAAGPAKPKADKAVVNETSNAPRTPKRRTDNRDPWSDGP